MAALTDVLVPDIGDFTDVPVVEILVAAGDAVAPEDPLVVLESDKATVEVPSPGAGVIGEILVAVGDKVSEGTRLLTLAREADAGAPAEAAAPGAVETAVVAEEASAPEPAPPVAVQPPVAAVAPAVPAAAAAGGEDAPIYASPSVRRLARELGVDLEQLAGSGRKGRIVPDDVRALVNGGGPSLPAGARRAGAGSGLPELLPWPSLDFERYGEVERVQLSKIRRVTAANLARNWVHIPHVTHDDEADVTELEAFRKRVNAEQPDVKVTMVALLLKAVSATLKAFPNFNSSLDGDELVLKRYYHLGFAADTPHGLVVPVVRDVDQKGLLDLAGELTELSERARAAKLSPAQMSGGTFTISSLGGIGGTSFTPLIQAPEVAILGVVRSVMKPVWNGQEFAPRLMLPLSLSYDHRVIDGADAARFMVHLTGVLTDLRRVLL